MQEQYKIASELMQNVLKLLEDIHENQIPGIEKEMEKLKSPWTPGRLPKFE